MQNFPFFSTAAERLSWARERYFEEGQRPSGLVSEPVIQSWQRCLSAGLRPQQAPAFDPVTRSRVSHALARSHALLQSAADEFEQLDRMLAGTGCRTVLTDGQGIVLRATGAVPGGRGILDVGTRVGVELAELQCGSTAPSVTAAGAGACSVSGGEHFFSALQQVHCVAAPIRTRDGSVAGVLDLSVEGRLFGFDALGIVKLAATAIENRLATQTLHEHLRLAFQIAPGLLGTPLEGLAWADGFGRLAWVNPAGAALLGGSDGDVGTRFGLTVDQLLAQGGDAAPQRLPSGLSVWLAVTAPGARAAPPPGPAALTEVHRQHIEATLAQCRGNISAAARRLGVSRGLLYRRLRAWNVAG